MVGEPDRRAARLPEQIKQGFALLQIRGLVNKPDRTNENPNMIEPRSKTAIGLTLSGGGARGLAHIGVLKVLEEEGIPIACLSGASMGGIVAAAYAAGWKPKALAEESCRMASLRQLARLIDIRPPRRGLLAGGHVRDFLAQFTPPELSFSDLRLPLALKATDLQSGSEVDLTEGSVLKAVMATSAFPGVFPAVEWQGHYLVDGGVLNNLPVDLAYGLGARLTIAVDVATAFDDPPRSSGTGPLEHLPPLAHDVYQTVMLMAHAMTKIRLEERPPDVLIHPRIPADVGIFTGFLRAEEIIAIGEQAARHALPEIRAALDRVL
jgi:NTE family protein